MESQRYLNMVRAFGVYHAIAIAPLMVPVLSEQVLFWLGGVHNYFNLQGVWPNADMTDMLFINLFACVAFLWAIVRVRHPSTALGTYEGWGMLAMSCIVIFYVSQGASLLWLLIPLVDIPGGLLHLLVSKNSDSP